MNVKINVVASIGFKMVLLSERFSETGVFWEIAISLGVDIPLFAYARLNGMMDLAVTGSLIIVFSSGLIAFGVNFSKLNGKY